MLTLIPDLTVPSALPLRILYFCGAGGGAAGYLEASLK